MNKTDLVLTRDQLTSPNKFLRSFTLENAYYRITVKYNGDYSLDVAQETVSMKKLRYNAVPADKNMEAFTPTLSGSGDMLVIYPKPAMLPDDLSFDIYLEFVMAAKETRTKFLDYITERFPE